MLVTLEGIDGSGKTTAWEALRESVPDATFTREPTESWYGDAVRRSIGAGDADPLAELFLYVADHAAHLARTVRPALARDELVISDRYADSRYAYQSASLSAESGSLAGGAAIEDPLAYIEDLHRPWTRRPDLTLYFDVDAETGADRSGASNKFEQVEFLRSVRARYEEVIAADPERFVRIDGTRSRDAVSSRALEAIEDKRADT